MLGQARCPDREAAGTASVRPVEEQSPRGQWPLSSSIPRLGTLLEGIFSGRTQTCLSEQAIAMKPDAISLGMSARCSWEKKEMCRCHASSLLPAPPGPRLAQEDRCPFSVSAHIIVLASPVRRCPYRVLFIPLLSSPLPADHGLRTRPLTVTCCSHLLLQLEFLPMAKLPAEGRIL